jgi:hypothetical protein
MLAAPRIQDKRNPERQSMVMMLGHGAWSMNQTPFSVWLGISFRFNQLTIPEEVANIAGF